MQLFVVTPLRAECYRIAVRLQVPRVEWYSHAGVASGVSQALPTRLGGGAKLISSLLSAGQQWKIDVASVGISQFGRESIHRQEVPAADDAAAQSHLGRGFFRSERCWVPEALHLGRPAPELNRCRAAVIRLVC